MRFFAESVDADGTSSMDADDKSKPASRMDSISTNRSMCDGTLHFAGEHLTLVSAQQFPIPLPREAMVQLAVATHPVLVLPR